MTFPRPKEDLALLNICWAYKAGIISKNIFIKAIDMLPHSMEEIKGEYRSREVEAIGINPKDFKPIIKEKENSKRGGKK